jgi:hypothetical protein
MGVHAAGAALLRALAALVSGALVAGVLLAAPLVDRAAAQTSAVPTGPGAAVDVPALAYFYIWFDATSWNRAKTDLPLAGKYSSDERTVMREQVQMAKAAGLDGFIVSWKRSEKLDRRLAALIDIAEEEDFGLVVIYQGLDFARQPLPVDSVTSDLEYFRDTYASRRPFRVFEKPAVILSGSWEYSAEEVATIGAGVRSDLLLLGSEKDVDGIRRLDGLIDGDAYYWSSVDPTTQRKYEERLAAMAEAVHATGGIWIPSAAPGFDARLVGGTSVVDRLDGETLRQELQVAMGSSPDALGVISWNEFSENSQIEPSRRYGTRYVEVLAELLGGAPPPESVAGGDGLDSSEPGGRGSGLPQAAALGAVGVAVVGATLVVGRRRRAVGAGPEP